MNNKKRVKKETAALVYKKIETALSEVKGKVKEKKFDKKLKKASKILAADIADAAGKDTKSAKKAKAVKDKTKKNSAKKEKKAAKAAKAAPVKMNNLPVAADHQPAPENALP